MRFFLDNCLPPCIARALDELVKDKHNVIHLRDRFPADIKDPQWIGELAKEGGWIIISADTRIPKNPQNKDAWLQSGLTAFFLKKRWTNLKLWDQAWRIVRRWPDIMAISERVGGGGYWVPEGSSSKLEQLRIK